jgi:hypothetical protein
VRSLGLWLQSWIGLANENWMSYFGKTIAEFNSGGISDHFPAVISVGILQSFGPPFKFYNYLLEHKVFSTWVKEGWNTQVEEVPMYQLYIFFFNKSNIISKSAKGRNP